jgi:hypothetical protein
MRRSSRPGEPADAAEKNARGRFVLKTATLTITVRPRAAIDTALRSAEPVIIDWPRGRAVQERQAPRPAVIVLPARPQGMQRLGRVRIWSPPPRHATAKS